MMTLTGDNEAWTGDNGGIAGAVREGYAVWAVRYGATERTVKRWMAHGRDKGEEPPLSNPGAMLEWWGKWMLQKAPRGVLEACRAAAPAGVVEEVTIPGGRGLEVELDRLEILAARLSVKAHEPGQAKPYLDTVARMVALTKQMREEAERLRKLLPRDLVESAIHEFHGPIEREVRLLYRTMCEIIGLGPSPEKEDAWNKEVDRLCGRFAAEVLA